MQIRRSGPRRVIALAVTSAIAVGLFAAPQAGLAAPTPPPNPTDGQLSGAAAQKASLAEAVGRASGLQADAQQQLTQQQNQNALDEQRSARAVGEYRTSVDALASAKAEETAAKKQYAAATGKIDSARAGFAQYMQAIYMDGSPTGLTGNLLTADDPNALLQQSSYQQYAVENNVDVIGRMQTLTVEKSNAAARKRTATARATKAAAAKKKAQAVAVEQARESRERVADGQVAVQQLTAQVATYQNQAQAAAAKLATLNGQRATYDAFIAEQRRQAEIRRQAKLARERAQAIQRAQAIERQQQQIAAEKARNKKSKKKKSGGSSSSGGGSSFNPPVYAPPAPTGKGWTQAKAAKALARAKSTLGMPYAWAGGGPSGPSYGVCDASNGAGGDCNVFGYDCSGLVMFAWKKDWAHYADTQYSQAGSVHPKKSKLKIGDLVFFGSRGGGNDLHHVAMYAGHGQIIEAPYSGGVVQYNSLNAYSDYYGATRPLT